MAFKIYVENNHIVVQDLVSDKEFRAASKEALFFKDRASEDTYNTNGFFPEGLQGIKFVDIVDENETPFVNEQAFIDFFSANTGNFNTAGASAQKQAIYYIGGQDNTGFTGVVEKFNNTGIDFELIREDVGTFSCAGFDKENHFIFHTIYINNKELIFNGEENIFQTVTNNPFTSTDSAFEFGGMIKIEVLN